MFNRLFIIFCVSHFYRAMELKNDKYYKTRPKHQFWINDGNIEKITAVGKDLNHWESINIESKKRTGAYVYGYMLKAGAKHTTEKEFKCALANCG